MKLIPSLPTRVHWLTSIGLVLLLAPVASAQPGGDSPSLAYRAAMAKAVRTAAQQVLPSIVTIEIIGASGQKTGEVEQDAPTSGVIVDKDGYILASSIVVRRPAASMLVILPDGSRHAAKVISKDQHRDLVLLKIDAKTELAPLDLPSEVTMTVGQTTVAVGRYGGGSSPMVSRGVLSATGRLDGIAIQTDARVAPSFYGGPLIDLYGNVLGILIPAVSKGGAEDSTSWYDSGIAFAIPSNVIVAKLDRLKMGEDIRKGLIGIVSKSRDPYQDETTIAAVRVRSPAEAAGILAGDEVLEVAGRPVRRQLDIRQALGSFDAGEKVRLKLRRDGNPIDVEVTLAETIPPLQPQRLGIIVREESGENEDGPNQVIVDAVLPSSPASDLFKTGDVVTKLGKANVTDTETLRRLALSAAPDATVALTIQRDGADQTIEVTPQSIAGVIPSDVPSSWKNNDDDEQAKWVTQKIQLPDSANDAAFLAPKTGSEDQSQQQLGLMIMLLNPGQDSPADVLEKWSASARQAGVVICAIAPEDAKRWLPKEMEIVAKFATAVLKKAAIDPAAVSITTPGALEGGKAGAADSMALAVAVSQSSTFFGVAVSAETRPPAMRLSENSPSAALQLLIPIKADDELPGWAAAVEKAGYPIVRGGEIQELILLQWTRLLQAI
ncbi:MAG: PDZ domain-containing protein [Rubripirellula sp.]|nr:PDZ domain-containing protein [Rubripirellula sp.]